MRSPAEHAQLALLLEVSSTPKPGNVDREREYPDLRFEHFMAGAVGAGDGLRALADPHVPLGDAFAEAIAGMSRQTGGNTQFGAILLLAPLVRAAARGPLGASRATEVVDETTVDDAAGFYRAFEHVDVAIDDPPAGLEPLDVRRGDDAIPALRRRELTWGDIMAASADVDGIGAEWTNGFPRTFAAAERLVTGDSPVSQRAAAVYLELLAEEPDTFVITQHDTDTATEVRDRAAAALAGEEDVTALATEFVDRGINPGTTADIVAGGLFVALERGLEV